MNRVAWRCDLASAKSVWLEKRNRQRSYALLKLLNIVAGDVKDVKPNYLVAERKRKRILRSKISQHLEYSDHASCFWIAFPDYLQIFAIRYIVNNGLFVMLPYILQRHNNERSTSAER